MHTILKWKLKEKVKLRWKSGAFKDLLYVPNHTSNLLSVYQITHCGGGNKAEFLPDLVVVKSIKDDSMVAVCESKHDSRIYTFSSFVPNSNAQALLIHSNIERKLWHERFGHLIYRYLHQLSRKNMVHGLPQVQFSDGVCSSCTLGKHPEKMFDKGKSWRSQSVLDLVHSVVEGPFPVPSFQKSHYALTFIDD